ncbi:hypothetical protein MM440_09010 [Arsenicicoccus piscis]|uniref:Uncharacterized protein n=1 Tax=Arsenicicoccus piscis TaxID=673954 RepID=A0ABQ6HQV7_9MICO|nr:hypothetical protein [Arsenicicoccus piscis]MCH8627921.1 hypothetical protein [Arsenicicoccus piscis]GMA20751.1 hypothetical protein GCM10025862_27720 [Arsenicicoccus piscis]
MALLSKMLLDRLHRLGVTGPRPTGRSAHEPRPTDDNLDADASVEGRLDPSTAALMDGAPPGSTSGRAQPERRPRPTGDPDPRSGPGAGASEADATHLPG